MGKKIGEQAINKTITFTDKIPSKKHLTFLEEEIGLEVVIDIKKSLGVRAKESQLSESAVNKSVKNNNVGGYAAKVMAEADVERQMEAMRDKIEDLDLDTKMKLLAQKYSPLVQKALRHKAELNRKG